MTTNATETMTREVKVCRACNQHRKDNRLIRERLARYNLTFTLVGKKNCEVCKGE